MFSGYLYLAEKNSSLWRTYWGVLKVNHLLELRKAPNDNLPELKIPLIGYELKECDTIDDEDGIVFELQHRNQVTNRIEKVYVFKTNGVISGRSWLQNLNDAVVL